MLTMNPVEFTIQSLLDELRKGVEHVSNLWCTIDQTDQWSQTNILSAEHFGTFLPTCHGELKCRVDSDVHGSIGFPSSEKSSICLLDWPSTLENDSEELFEEQWVLPSISIVSPRNGQAKFPTDLFITRLRTPREHRIRRPISCPPYSRSQPPVTPVMRPVNLPNNPQGIHFDSQSEYNDPDINIESRPRFPHLTECSCIEQSNELGLSGVYQPPSNWMAA